MFICRSECPCPREHRDFSEAVNLMEITEKIVETYARHIKEWFKIESKIIGTKSSI
jgi:hypothetical protein